MSYQSKHTGAAIDASVDITQQILNMIYPVGSIYMSVNNVSPATFIGGTWTALTDRVLIGAGSSYAVNATGGATSHTHTSAAHTHTSAAHTHTTAGHVLTTSEIPKHYHTDWHWESPSGSQFGVNNYGATGASTKGTWKVAYSSTSSEASFYTGYTGGGASHSHGNTGSTTPGNTGSTTPGNTGSSSNLPPYLAVYMWKRTA